MSKSRVQILSVPFAILQSAAAICGQTGLLINDALIVALMQQHGVTRLASHDADFDRVSGLTRYSPG
jgi:predicted nucleic acid-binding protein